MNINRLVCGLYLAAAAYGGIILANKTQDHFEGFLAKYPNLMETAMKTKAYIFMPELYEALQKSERKTEKTIVDLFERANQKNKNGYFKNLDDIKNLDLG